MMDHRKESQRIFRAQSHRTPDDMRSHKKRVDSPQEFSLDHKKPFHLHLGSPFPKGALQKLPLVITSLLCLQATLKMPAVAAKLESSECDGLYNDPETMLQQMAMAAYQKKPAEFQRLTTRYGILSAMDGEDSLTKSAWTAAMLLSGPNQIHIDQIPEPAPETIKTQVQCIRERLPIIGKWFVEKSIKERSEFLDKMEKELDEQIAHEGFKEVVCEDRICMNSPLGMLTKMLQADHEGKSKESLKWAQRFTILSALDGKQGYLEGEHIKIPYDQRMYHHGPKLTEKDYEQSWKKQLQWAKRHLEKGTLKTFIHPCSTWTKSDKECYEKRLKILNYLKTAGELHVLKFDYLESQKDEL